MGTLATGKTLVIELESALASVTVRQSLREVAEKCAEELARKVFDLYVHDGWRILWVVPFHTEENGVVSMYLAHCSPSQPGTHPW